MQPKKQVIEALVVGIDAVTTSLLSEFFEQCGVPAKLSIDTPSRLERALADSDGSILFIGEHGAQASSFVEVVQAATAGQLHEVLVVSDKIDENAMRFALRVRAADVLATPLDRGTLMTVFQRTYRQLSAHVRARSLQTYVAESLRLLSGIALSFGKPNVAPPSKSAINLSLLVADDPTLISQKVEPGSTASRLMIADITTSLAQMRRKKFGDIFSDPGWDIALDLYRNHLLEESVSVTSACLAAPVPASTAMRKIAQLEEAGLVKRVKDIKDGRRVLLDLTPTFRKQLEDYFTLAEALLTGTSTAERRRERGLNGSRGRLADPSAR